MAEALAATAQFGTLERDPMLENVFDASEQLNPIETVTARHESNMLGTIVEHAKSRFNKVERFLKQGGAVVLGSLALGGMTETAAAQTTTTTTQNESQSATINPDGSKTTMEFRVAGSKFSGEQSIKAEVLANYRVVSKAKIRKLEEQGKCQTFDGKKTEIYTEGLSGNGRNWGHDTRTSTFCKNERTVVKNGKRHKIVEWVRAKCGNRAKINVRPKKVVEHPKWVNSLSKATLTVKAKERLVKGVECKTANTRAFAIVDVSAEATASSKVKTAFKKGKGKFNKMVASAKSRAAAAVKIKFNGQMEVVCAEVSQSETTPPPPPPPTKDGTQGPGEGTEGQPGGPGAGGEAGNTEKAVPCYDPDNTTAGDQIATTSGEIMYVAQESEKDQFGYCLVPAESRQG
jgi:hypothetical protein